MAHVRVGSESEIAEGSAVVISAADAGTQGPIAVFNDGGQFFAIDDTCTHAEASLAQGWIEDGEVECPLHSACFDLRTGEATCLPATVGVATHRVEIRDGDVYVFPGEPA